MALPRHALNRSAAAADVTTGRQAARRTEVALNPTMKTLNLALQGGGSHGAFTWGVLDALLADPRIALEGLSGTSAGAVNAVALASGYARGLADGTDPRRGARDCLARIWDQVAAWGTVGSLQRRFG